MSRLVVAVVAVAIVVLIAALATGASSREPAAAPAVAAPHVISAILYFQPTTNRMARRVQRGNAQLVFRTSRPLPRTQSDVGNVRIGGGLPSYFHTISERLRCYGSYVHVDPDGTISVSRKVSALPGSRVRVEVGEHGEWLDRRLTVQPMRRGYVNGLALGCGRDRRVRVQLYNLTETPLWEPSDYFLSANAGPYVEDLLWHGWGGERAEGRGVYVSRCASCGEATTRPAKIVLRDSAPCREYGGRVYRVGVLETRDDANRKHRSRIPTGYPCR